MNNIIEKLKLKKNRQSTYENYYQVWKTFNKFLIRLDHMPDSWEERTALYCAYLVDTGRQSATIKSYISAIKCILKDDDYKWDENRVLLESITRACKLVNDRVKTRLPISEKLLELMLFELNRIYDQQPYLRIMFQTILAMGYHGLLRIGELVSCGTHTILAKDVHVAKNKNKILIVLYSSKTHGKESRPQKVKITGKTEIRQGRFFCPFTLIKQYMDKRGSYEEDNEPFFIFRDGSHIKGDIVRKMMAVVLKKLGLNPACYSVHSLRIGKSTEMLKNGFSIPEIKRAGRWTSGAVYKYLRS